MDISYKNIQTVLKETLVEASKVINRHLLMHSLTHTHTHTHTHARNVQHTYIIVSNIIQQVHNVDGNSIYQEFTYRQNLQLN